MSTGVTFAVDEAGRRSTTAAATTILQAALHAAEPAYELMDTSSKAWRKGYIKAFVDLTGFGVDPALSTAMARAGLEQLRNTLVWVDTDGAQHPLSEALADVEAPATVTVRGTGTVTEQVQVPYRGTLLSGAELQAQLATWVSAGAIEPGFADRIRAVMAHPEWLRLDGHQLTLIGGGAAMSPLGPLLDWGADVAVVDIPDAGVATKLTHIAESKAGSLSMPKADDHDAPGLHANIDLNRVNAWITSRLGADVPVLGTFVYADGAAHVEVNAAVDLLAESLQSRRPDTVLSVLNTPTDAYLVPTDVVSEARARATSRADNKLAYRGLRTVSGGRLFTPSYASTLTGPDGVEWGLADSMVDVQGPNYALAKRVQRWRAIASHEAGLRVSTAVAPASWTHSVTKNKALAAAYAGASAFGVEVFDAATARTLMAVRLVADVMDPQTVDHPESLFVDAAHGGLWRQPFEPRSALTIAALYGAPRALFGRR